MYRLNVLIVDDLETNRTVLRHLLEALACNSVEAGSGIEALSLLHSEYFDMVLLDIHMPEVSGFEVVERLRGMCSLNAHTRVVAVTADVTRSESRYLQAGFDAYLNKPVSVASLFEQVGKAGLQIEVDPGANRSDMRLAG